MPFHQHDLPRSKRGTAVGLASPGSTSSSVSSIQDMDKEASLASPNHSQADPQNDRGTTGTDTSMSDAMPSNASYQHSAGSPLIGAVGDLPDLNLPEPNPPHVAHGQIPLPGLPMGTALPDQANSMTQAWLQENDGNYFPGQYRPQDQYQAQCEAQYQAQCRAQHQAQCRARQQAQCRAQHQAQCRAQHRAQCRAQHQDRWTAQRFHGTRGIERQSNLQNYRNPHAVPPLVTPNMQPVPPTRNAHVSPPVVATPNPPVSRSDYAPPLAVAAPSALPVPATGPASYSPHLGAAMPNPPDSAAYVTGLTAPDTQPVPAVETTHYFRYVIRVRTSYVLLQQ